MTNQEWNPESRSKVIVCLKRCFPGVSDDDADRIFDLLANSNFSAGIGFKFTAPAEKDDDLSWQVEGRVIGPNDDYVTSVYRLITSGQSVCNSMSLGNGLAFGFDSALKGNGDIVRDKIMAIVNKTVQDL